MTTASFDERGFDMSKTASRRAKSKLKPSDDFMCFIDDLPDLLPLGLPLGQGGHVAWNQISPGQYLVKDADAAIAMFLRVSTDSQFDSLQTQAEMAVREAKRRGVRIGAVYVDPAISATRNPVERRPGARSLLRDILSRPGLFVTELAGNIGAENIEQEGFLLLEIFLDLSRKSCKVALHIVVGWTRSWNEKELDGVSGLAACPRRALVTRTGVCPAMPIVLPLAHSVQGYLQRYGQVGPDLPLWCGHCDTQPLHRHGCYWRGVVCRQRIYRIPIYRWKCPRCGRTVSVLPDFLKPYARFLSLLREKAVWRRLAGWQWERIAAAVSSTVVSVVSVRTLLRWFKRALSWAAGRGTEPLGRLVEVAPSVDIGVLKPSDGKAVDVLRFVRQTSQLLQHQVGRPNWSHPGLYAFLNSLLGGPPYL